MMYFFALTGNVKVVAEVYMGYISIFASSKFIHQPYEGLEALRVLVDKEFGGGGDAVSPADY